MIIYISNIKIILSLLDIIQKMKSFFQTISSKINYYFIIININTN